MLLYVLYVVYGHTTSPGQGVSAVRAEIQHIQHDLLYARLYVGTPGRTLSAALRRRRRDVGRVLAHCQALAWLALATRGAAH